MAERSTRCLDCHAPHYAEAGGCADCHRGQPTAARRALAHARLLSGRAAEHVLARGPAVSEGRVLVETLACRRCHVIDGRGTGLATNLDGAVWKREQSALVTSIETPVENMPAFGFNRPQTEGIIAFLLNRATRGAIEEEYRVQFAREGANAPSTFDEKCGGCHRMLTRLGPLGKGRDGPNLSGLLTAFYPNTAPLAKSWTEKVLREWVANPRALRSSAIMPPVPLTGDQLDQVMDAIRTSASAGVTARR